MKLANSQLDLPADSLDRLIVAAESLELLEWRDEQTVGLGTLGVAMVGNPAVAMM